MNLLKILAASALLTVGMVACDSSSDGDGGGAGGGGGGGNGCGLQGRDGITPCSGGLLMCQAGQYCVDDLSCEPGCTSDQNCAANEFCDKASGEAVGVCARCQAQGVQDAGVGGGGGGGDCALIAQRAAECGVVPADQQAALQTACETENDPATGPVASCIRTAGADCAQVTSCLTGGGGGGAGGGGGGNNGQCGDDSDCDQTPGLLHEICSGGFCQPGCRADADCGADFVCDTDFNSCEPDGF